MCFCTNIFFKKVRKNIFFPMHMCGPSFQKKEVIELMDYWIFHLQTKWCTETTFLHLCYVHFVKTKFENSVSVSYDNYCPVSVKMEKGRGWAIAFIVVWELFSPPNRFLDFSLWFGESISNFLRSFIVMSYI